MTADRPAKKVIRQMWLDILKNVADATDAHPVYLTLPGAEGKDVQLLIDERVISVTETGAIDASSANYCIAVENSKPAVLELQRRFPGLRILQQDIKGVLRGNSILSYPDREHRAYCQAHVVNLDLPGTLDGEIVGDDAIFPIVRWIEKFGTLHLEWPHRKWHLLLTLNATIQWSLQLSQWVSTFLRENFARVAAFRAHAARILDAELLRAIEEGVPVAFSQLQLSVRQRVLLVLVPKAIGHCLCRQGWAISTKLNAEYPGAEGAPMVTYIFTLSKAVGQSPYEGLYTQAISECLNTVQRVTAVGDVEEL